VPELRDAQPLVSNKAARHRSRLKRRKGDTELTYRSIGRGGSLAAPAVWKKAEKITAAGGGGSRCLRCTRHHTHLPRSYRNRR
jgi:hypothetical protein